MESVESEIKVTLEGGRTRFVPPHTPVRRLAPGSLDAGGLHYLGALVNNDVVSMSYPLEVDCTLQLLTIRDPHGYRIYRRSVSFLLAKAVRELFPEARFAVEHSLGTGFYCSFELNGGHEIADHQLRAIEARMREMVERQMPIQRRKIGFVEAVQQLEREKQWDKLNLLQFRNPPKVVVCTCDGFSDLAHGPLAENTAALAHFQLIPYPPGFVLQFPERENAPAPAPFERQPHLFAIFKEHKEWGRILGVRTVGDLNAAIANRNLDDFIKIAEAFHEKKIARIADEVARRKEIKWILVAGPSSSGKTTFAKRLAVQLRVNGLRPVTISTDNYFVNREQTPRDADGHPDFEHIETIDLALFNQDLDRLDRGEEVALPRFNFEQGKREYRGETLKVEPDQLMLVEGIHSLNPRLTQSVPSTHKFRIYISALTQLSLDFNNRISTTDNRLIRRIVRDSMFRGNTALATLHMWPSVRRGEKRWIFPFQQEADIAFNSALDYELAVLKPVVEPLLAEIKPFHEQYGESRRLMEFLGSFLSIPSHLVPPTSILREFIGKSSFRY